DLPLVAETPGADALALEIRHGLDAVAGPRDLQGSRLLIDLCDVGEFDTRRFQGAEHLGYPGDGEVDVAGDEGVLRNDVTSGRDDLDAVETFLLEVALVEGNVVAGELRLREPLELELDRRDCLELLGAAGVGFRGGA